MTSYRALRIVQDQEGAFQRNVVNLDTEDLPEGDLLIDVHYSSLNYKDALSATGVRGVTRSYPHTPGIDVAGTVIESSTDKFARGDEVVAIGFDLGMNTDGGFGERVRIPSGWAVPLPSGLTLRESMIIGTAGLTAGLCLQKLEDANSCVSDSPALVTGATGGVGSVAVAVLSQIGFEVVAVTGKSDQHQFLKNLGATEVISRQEFMQDSKRPLQKEQWGAVVDTVGGDMLVQAVNGLKYGRSAAACGLVNSPSFPGTVLPFILRSVNLLGVDSVHLPIDQKAALWARLSSDWKLPNLAFLESTLTLEQLNEGIDRILEGKMVGRGILKHAIAN